MAHVNEQVNEQGLENMKVMLTGKADREEMERNLAMKSNKIDFENMLDVQGVLVKQFQQMLVLFIEVVNCQVVKPNDTKSGIEKKVHSLIQQVTSLSHWVFNFDPLTFFNSSDATNT